MLPTHLPFCLFSGFRFPPSAFASCLLAQTPPLSTDEWSHGLFAILILLIILVAVSTIWKNFRPEPSLEKQIEEKINKATTALETRIEKKLDDLKLQIGGREKDIHELRASMEKAVADLNRAIGFLEGKAD
jgi:hypothetical protein